MLYARGSKCGVQDEVGLNIQKLKLHLSKSLHLQW